MSREQEISRVFVELADTLVAEYDVVDLLHTLAERCVDLLHADAAGIMLSDQRGSLQALAATSREARILELLELQNAEGPCLDCFSSGRPVVNLDPEEAASRWPQFNAATAKFGYRSAHALPLRLRDRVIGAMNLFCVEQRTLSDDDIALGQALADVATIGLLHERAVREQEVLAEQLQTTLNSRVLIEQAKGALAERANVEVDEAFVMMRSHSKQTRRRLRNVAAEVLDGSLSPDQLQPS